MKPPYELPTMRDARAAEGRAGLVVASTFAGAGGSSIGYRLAGFGVVWANEFHAPAAETYRRNFADTIVDERDIRTLRGADVLGAIGIGAGELDVLDGSPPCQSFSLAGRRQRGWGREMHHADGTTQRSDDLFFDYARLVREVRPRVFVAENVAGLARGLAKGYLAEILGELREGYRVQARILDAQWLGVPQMRERVIVIGVRDDLGAEPAFPAPLTYRYALRDACPWLDGAQIVDVGGYHDGRRRPASLPAYTITASGLSSGGREQTLVETREGERRRFTVEECRRLMSFPADYDLEGLSEAQQWARLGNAVPPLMMRAIAETIRDRILRAKEAAA